MATSFEEIYCLNAVIKNDQRLYNKPTYMIYSLNWKYLQLAIALFQYDCRKNLYDFVPFSLTSYSFIGDSVNNIFKLDPAPDYTMDTNFYITKQLDCEKPVLQETSYTWDDINDTIILDDIPEIGSTVTIYAYEVGQFNEDLDFDEKRILAEAMNIFYFEEYMTNSKVLNFATYGGSIKMHSQAEQLKTVTAAYQASKREVEGDISKYTYKTAPFGLGGLGARTTCYYPLMCHRRPTVCKK